MFDCAGLTQEPHNILDELAQQAAIEALRNSSVVVFCVDASKEDWSEDILIRQLITPQALIPVATKSDLLSEESLANRIAELNKLFNVEFLPTSAETDAGLEQLRDAIDEKLIEISLGGGKRGTRDEARETSLIALTARHKQAVTDAIENVGESISELKAGETEVTAMLLRAAYQQLSTIEQQHIDEEILDRIFSRFCIGK
jgi:tRNA modification GTPase